MRSYDAELSIALREAERSTVIPNEFKRLVRLAEAGALLRDKRNREREGGSYFM